MSQKIHNVKSLYLEGIRDGNPRDVMKKYTGHRYTQHSTGVGDGKDGFIEFFDDFLIRNPVREIDIVRIFEEGQYVFVHAYQNLNNGDAKWVTMDFFETDPHDKIIEHWDVITAYNEQPPGALSQINGPTTITYTGETHKNKALVEAMIHNVLARNSDTLNAAHYIHPHYIDHSAKIIDGLQLLLPPGTSSKRICWYDEIVLLVGCGNFVATLCKVRDQGRQYAQMDLFRVEAGKIIEHWDTTEPVCNADKGVNSGKF